jgi:LacI family transcriptional regulator
MIKRVTLKDVAQRANVSVMTVSNVINGNFQHVTVKTRRKVEAAIAALRYRTHSSGRALRLSRHFAVGMIVVDPSPRFIADAFTTNLVAGLGNQLSKQGYGLLLQGTPFEELPRILMLRHSLVDGICIFCSGNAQQRRAVYRQLAGHREPVVVFQDAPAAELADVMAIRQDDRAGGEMLAERLISAGCKNLLYLTVAHRWPALDAREKGMRAALRKLDGAKLTTLKAMSTTIESIQAVLAKYIATSGLPDAILAANDQTAIAAQNWLIDHGTLVPQQVKITGFNAFDFARFAKPILTTVRSPAYELGELGANELLRRLETGYFSNRELVLPVTLEIGQSA